MSPLFETIKCKDGKLYNLDWHNIRFNRSGREIFGSKNERNLEEIIEIPEYCLTGLFRCRITYQREILNIEFIPHVYRKIKTLKLVACNEIRYAHKWADRSKLTELFQKRGDCDDILIIKNGCITDSYTANPVFFDGREWWTADSPLLPGTQRARLLTEGKLKECRITPSDLPKYELAGLINALQDLDEMPVIHTSGIIY